MTDIELEKTQLDTLIKHFEELSLLKKQAGETWRAISYEKASRTLRELPENEHRKFYVSTDLKGIGKSIYQKIEEFLQKGNISEIKKSRDDILLNKDYLSIIDSFCNVWGVGSVKAKKLYTTGYRSVDELQELALKEEKTGEKETFTSAQKIGLRYYDDFNKRIPRAEITRTWNRIRDLWTLKHGNIIKRLDICGSYRRGLANSGDIDILLCYHSTVVDSSENKPKYRNDWILTKLVETLREEGIVSEDLCLGKHKYMGVCKTSKHGKNKDIGRRLDILVIPQEEYAFAKLHFTGSWEFNRCIRQIALHQGKTLSEHGIKAKDTKLNLNNNVYNSEKDIFDALGVSYIPPELRNDKVLLAYIKS